MIEERACTAGASGTLIAGYGLPGIGGIDVVAEGPGRTLPLCHPYCEATGTLC
jgi:hypothetical protein